jgi:hypothetical protein
MWCLEKDGEYRVDRCCEIEVLFKLKEKRNSVHKIKRRKDNWIGHVLPRNCLLKHVTEKKKNKGKFISNRKTRKKT